MRQAIIKCLESGKIQEWTIEEVLSEINRDRSDMWVEYDEYDWRSGWYEWCEGQSYTLVGVEDYFFNREDALAYVKKRNEDWGDNLIGWVEEREGKWFPCFNVWD